MAVTRLRLLIASAAGLFAAAAAAQPMSVGGVTFSDEYGGFTIAAASGSGSLKDPFIVVEEITGPTAAVLIIQGIVPEFGNRIGTLHPTGFALRKIVRNETPFVWTFIDFELQQVLGVSSDYLDGLSFGQGSVSGRPFTSDRFDDTFEFNEPLDAITFQGGALRPGESAVFDFVITDTTPVQMFYLVQRPNRPIALLSGNGAAHPGGGPW